MRAERDARGGQFRNRIDNDEDNSGGETGDVEERVERRFARFSAERRSGFGGREGRNRERGDYGRRYDGDREGGRRFNNEDGGRRSYGDEDGGRPRRQWTDRPPRSYDNNNNSRGGGGEGRSFRRFDKRDGNEDGGNVTSSKD